MREFEAIYGVFINRQDQVLLLQRTWKRTYRRGKWDLMGGEIQLGETPEEAFIRETREKLHMNPIDYIKLRETMRIRETTGVGIRHCFVSRDPIRQVELDPKKYRKYEWVEKNGLVVPPISSGIRSILQHANI